MPRVNIRYRSCPYCQTNWLPTHDGGPQDRVPYACARCHYVNHDDIHDMGASINTVHGAAIHGDRRLTTLSVTDATAATMISISSRPFQQNRPCTGSSPYSTSLPCIYGGCSHLMLTSCLQQLSRIKRLHGWPLQRTDNGPRTSLYGYRTQNPQNIVLQPLQLPVAA